MDWKWVSGRPFSEIPGMDPFADWLFGPGADHFTNGTGLSKMLIPFLFVPLDDNAAKAFKAIAAPSPHGANEYVLVPSIYNLSELRVGLSFTVFGTIKFFKDLPRATGDFATLRNATKLIKLGLPLRKSGVAVDGPVHMPPVSDVEWSKEAVVVAIIDDGIAFAHERFLTTLASTRVQYFWRQDGPAADRPTVNIGREIWKESLDTDPGIDALVLASTTAGLVDEDAVYRQARLVDFTLGGHKAAALTLAHGTFVLDVAAGARPSKNRIDRPIIAVQLPIQTTANTSGSNLDVYAKLAVDYILKRVSQMDEGQATRLPVVINFSYGKYASSHDGTSALEIALDQVIDAARGRLSIVLPAGNGNLDRCHAEVSFKRSTDVVTLEWQVQPENATSAHVEIWTPWDDGHPPSSSRVAVSLETPGGLSSAALEEKNGEAVLLEEADGSVIGQMTYRFVEGRTGRGVFCISLQPTIGSRLLELSETSSPSAPSGVWRIRIGNQSLGPMQPVNAWIQRDDSVYGYPPRGRQSYFQDRCYQPYDDVTGGVLVWDHEDDPSVPACEVKRRGMVNAIATGERAIVVGGIDAKDLRIAPYSAGGPICQGARPLGNPHGVDVSAVSDASAIHAGLIAAGSRSGAKVVMNGTSVAVPQITRLVADILQRDGECPRSAVQKVAKKEEDSRRPPDPPGHPDRYGAGRITSMYAPDRPRIDDPNFLSDVI